MNWKTTLFGFGTAFLNLLANGASPKQAGLSIGMAAWGLVQKDNNVSGDKRLFPILPAFSTGALIAILTVAMLVSFSPFVGGTAQAQTTIAQQPSGQTISSVTFTYANGDYSNQVYITIVPKTESGAPLSLIPVTLYLSDQPDGSGVTMTASSGTIGMLLQGSAAGNGILIGVTAATPTVATSRVPMSAITDAANGRIKFGILDTAKTLVYPVALFNDGRRFVGPKLATTDYK